MSLFGLCMSNKPGDTGFDQLKRIRPRYLVVMEGQAGAIRDIRRDIPECRIALRAEDAGRAWDPPAAGYTPDGYARDFAAFMNENRPDIGIPWNEANIEWKSFFPNPDNCRPEQYQRLANWARDFLAAYRTYSTVPIAWPAISPGHRTDDFEESSRILAPVAALFDETHHHFYYPDFSEWAGGRWRRELPFYVGSGKPQVITETNREFNRNDGADVQRMVEDTRRFFREAGPHFTHICYFIENSDSFPTMNSRDCGPLEALFTELAATPQGENPMPKQTVITAKNIPTMEPGGSAQFSFNAQGVDGQAKGFADVAYPVITGSTTEERYGRNETVEVGPFGDGDQTVTITAGPVNTPLPGGVVGAITLRIVEIDGTTFDGGAHGPFPVSIGTGAVAQPPQEVPGTVLDVAWQLAGDLHNAFAQIHMSDAAQAALKFHEYIKWLKSEPGASNPFSTPRK